MTWNISVSHEDLDGRTRLVIEAESYVPEIVISSIAASYWEEEVLFPEEWVGEEFDDFEDGLQGPGGLHG